MTSNFVRRVLSFSKKKKKEKDYYEGYFKQVLKKKFNIVNSIKLTEIKDSINLN